MASSTHEQTLNVALGEVLDGLRRSWTTRVEELGALDGGGRADIIILEASGWPVVVEAERSNYASAEADAVARLGRTVDGRPIETAIALVYPPELHSQAGAALRTAINSTRGLEYALYTRRINEPPERLPEAGWIRGGVRDLAMLVNRAAVPAPRVEALATEIERGVDLAADAFSRRHARGSELGALVADVLGQTDDSDGQTRRMAMTVIANALVFHESLAEAGFQVSETLAGDRGGAIRPVRHVDFFRPDGLFNHGNLGLEWERILNVNYWPIFWSAKEILGLMAVPTANAVLDRLWQTAQRLVAGGVTRSHDLMGIVFQRLIADRKFLATYYTRPEAAALLSALALPADRPPGGSDWGDADTLSGVQIGDFACGTGTLLSAAYQRMSLLHELHGGDSEALHRPMMKHGLVGLDVLPIAVHLTAAMLAGSHPATPFDGECLLTMPYAKPYRRQNGNGNGKPKEAIAIGSLDLLAPQVQPSLIDTAAAQTAGGRAPEEVLDLVSRVGHAKFDLVIMNPPFTRSGGTEGETLGAGNAAFAAFNTSRATQKKMQDSLVALRGTAPIASGNAGLAADFLDLATRKARPDGTIALVLPLSAVSGGEWERARQLLAERYGDITVVTIAGAGTYDASFSADTGMAECLIIARQDAGRSERRGTFVVLRRRVRSAVEGELLAAEITRLRAAGEAPRLESTVGPVDITLGGQPFAVVVDAPLPEYGPWPVVGITDGELAQVGYQLEQGQLLQLGRPRAASIVLPVVPTGQIADRGLFHLDIYSDLTDGNPRGPFQLLRPPSSAVPTYPMLWAHHAKSERSLVVAPDSEGRIKSATQGVTQADLQKKAGDAWSTASRAHYCADLRFNSQSLIVAMTERKCIGGRAWPSVVFENPEDEYAFALWCNSTLGLLMHWWTSNKTQSGRGTTSVTGIPNIPTLDTRALSAEQHAAAKAAFQAMGELRFLPFDQVDEDPARAELDRRLIVDVLGMPESLCEAGGPVDLLRRKLAREPQVHGGKLTRVVFYETVDDNGNPVVRERAERRSDR